jgi:hypothetical protein
VPSVTLKVEAMATRDQPRRNSSAIVICASKLSFGATQEPSFMEDHARLTRS